MALRTETRMSGAVVVLRCLGRLVSGEESAFRERVKKLLGEKHRIVLGKL